MNIFILRMKYQYTILNANKEDTNTIDEVEFMPVLEKLALQQQKSS
jgi:hypothetical protein